MADDNQTMDVTMPDGGIVRGVPVGTPKDTIMQKYNAKSGGNATTPTGGDKGLLGNVISDVGKRFDTGSKILNSDQNPLSKALQVGGKVIAGTVNDITGDVAKSAYNNLVPNTVKEKISGGVQKAMNSTLGKEGIEIAKKGALGYVNWAKEHPEAAANLESLVDIATVIPAGKAAKSAAGLVGDSAAKAAGTVEDLGKTTEKLKNQATDIIEKAKNSGGVLTPNLPTDAAKEVSQIAELSTAGDIANAPKTHAAVKNFLDSINEKEVKAPDGTKQPVSGDLTLRNLLGHRQAFDTIATTNSGSAESIAAKKVSSSIENIINQAVKNDEIRGANKQDVESLDKFKSSWSKYKQHQSLVSALDSSQESSSKARNAMAKIRDSKFFTSYPPEAQKFINAGAKGRTRGEILDAVGKLKRVANFKNLGWAEIAATLLHSPSLAIGAAGLSAVSHAAEAGGKRVAAGDIRKAIKAVEDQP